VWSAPIANLWRTTSDIQDNFGAMLVNFYGTVDLSAHAGPGAWNDPDLLQLGNGGSSLLEYRTEFSLWAEMAAPLIASTNLTALSSGALAVYENRNVIAVDQDPLGAQGVPIARTGGRWVLTKQLQNGDRSVVLFNSTNTATKITTTAAAAGLPAAHAYRLQDLWTGAVTETGGQVSAFVPAHAVVMYRVSVAHRPAALAPQVVLSLAPAAPQLDLGETTIVRETFENDGVSTLKGLKLTFRLADGWRLKRLGPARAKRVAPGRRFTVAFRITAPPAGSALTLAPVSGGAIYDPPARDLRRASAILGERVFATVPAPFGVANTTSSGATFGARDGGFAISARGAGVLQPIAAAPTDSYGAIYERQRAGPSSTAQVTVTFDPAGGKAGGAGLIEREAMTAPPGSPAGVALFINGSGSVVMSWNASGGRYVDSRFAVQNLIVHVPVTLRLVRSGSTYTGYFSTNVGVTWSLVDTVTVASAASAGNQDVGVFHASGLSTWSTTAKFTDLLLQ
jgi:alpha-galactosidase